MVDFAVFFGIACSKVEGGAPWGVTAISGKACGSLDRQRRKDPPEPARALPADSADQGKNIGQALVMSGTMRSSPGARSSSFMSSSASQSWQPA